MDPEQLIGPRQTVDRARHPEYGEGRAVYDHGPAMFLPNDGAAIPMRSIGMGGASSSPHRSWLHAVTHDGKRIELDTTGRYKGNHHHRRWSPLFGMGWLVHEAGIPWREGMNKADEARYNASRGWVRFEPDSGEAPIRWQWSTMRVGRLQGRAPKKGPAAEEWEHWTTIGDMEFRDDAPPENEAQDQQEKQQDAGQLSLGI